MSAETKDNIQTRTPSIGIGIVPALSPSFWINWLLAAMAGEIVGRALSQIYLHRSGRVIAALLLCFLAMSILQGATRRLPRTIFWSAACLLSLLGAVLAKTTDISMGGGDIGAILLIAILLIFSFVICYRLTESVPCPTDRFDVRGFFWVTALLAQSTASACADWITDPGGPSERQAIAVIALGIAATIVAYGCMRTPRSLLFWPAFVLSGTLAALGGHVALKSIELGAEYTGASYQLSDGRFAAQRNALGATAASHRPVKTIFGGSIPCLTASARAVRPRLASSEL